MSADFFVHLGTHVALAASALAIAIAAGVPLAAALVDRPLPHQLAFSAIGIFRVVPSLAVLTLALPYLGLGFRPALLALVLLAIPPIAINTDVGLRTVPATLTEAARGMGMTRRQIRRRIEWPLAFPVVLSGIRTAAVEVVASATLASFIGGGGLGDYIIDGLSTNSTGEILGGAAAVAALALSVDAILGFAARRAVSGCGRAG
jgi:osmoprotectant transport system permease protein